MSTMWFTSDWHFGHSNVLGFGPGRPFDNIAAHDAELIARHNAVVAPDDEVWVLGDVALGDLTTSLACCAAMNGRSYLLCGNHDRPTMARGADKAHHWAQRYRDEGGFTEVIIEDSITIALPSGTEVLASHYPYAGDATTTERFIDRRPVDQGQWLVHGHVHHRWRVRARQINVGVDAWHYRPVPWTVIDALVS
jgi:calcineurin-like phosphoesterase family protein